MIAQTTALDLPHPDEWGVDLVGAVLDRPLPAPRAPCTCPELLAQGKRHACPACQAWNQQHPTMRSGSRIARSATERALEAAPDPRAVQDQLARLHADYQAQQARVDAVRHALETLQAQRVALVDASATSPQGQPHLPELLCEVQDQLAMLRKQRRRERERLRALANDILQLSRH